MTPHPDFERLEIPETLTLGAFELRILTAKDLDEDYQAIVQSEPVLRGLFGPDWPRGWTRAANETDLHWHHREFTAKRSFAWVIRLAAQGYVGCAYLTPDIGGRGRGSAAYWIRDRDDRLDLLADFGGLYGGWLVGTLPSDYRLSVLSNAHLGLGCAGGE